MTYVIDKALEKAKRLGKTRNFQVVEARPGDSSSPRVWKDLVDGTLYNFVVTLPSPSAETVGTIRLAYIPSNEPIADVPLGNGYVALRPPATWDNPEMTTAPDGSSVRKYKDLHRR